MRKGGGGWRGMDGWLGGLDVSRTNTDKVGKEALGHAQASGISKKEALVDT